MKIDETALIELQDYVNHLEETVGLKPATVIDIQNAIAKKRQELKQEGTIVGTIAFDPIKKDLIISKK